MRRFFLICFIFSASPALAAEWNIRPWDEVLTRAEVNERLIGQEVTFSDGGVAQFESSGRYIYTYRGGRAFVGTYEVGADGAVCITFESGAQRCDLYVRQGSRLVMIAETGLRYPAVP